MLSVSGPRTYIHEFVEIRDHNRANYFQHITANWGPIGQREREQLCFGIWGTVGSTARWPEVINLWEYRDWAHLGENFRIECDHPTLQDPSLVPWWSAAVEFRRGGFDRILVAPDWSPGIEDHCAAGGVLSSRHMAHSRPHPHVGIEGQGVNRARLLGQPVD